MTDSAATTYRAYQVRCKDNLNHAADERTMAVTEDAAQAFRLRLDSPPIPCSPHRVQEVEIRDA